MRGCEVRIRAFGTTGDAEKRRANGERLFGLHRRDALWLEGQSFDVP